MAMLGLSEVRWKEENLLSIIVRVIHTGTVEGIRFCQLYVFLRL